MMTTTNHAASATGPCSPNPDELLAEVRSAQSAVGAAIDAGYGDLPRCETAGIAVIRSAGRLTAAVGALDEHLMGGGHSPADWQHAKPGPGHLNRDIAHHGVPTNAPASTAVEPLRITVAQLAAEHIGWEIRVTEPGSMIGCRTFTLAGVRSWKRAGKTAVALVDGDDTHGGIYAGTERAYPPETPCELIRHVQARRRRRRRA
jgi:hypothetical protein